MNKETLLSRLAEIQKAKLVTQANLHAMHGQEIEIKFWLSQLDEPKTELKSVSAGDAS